MAQFRFLASVPSGGTSRVLPVARSTAGRGLDDRLGRHGVTQCCVNMSEATKGSCDGLRRTGKAVGLEDDPAARMIGVRAAQHAILPLCPPVRNSGGYLLEIGTEHVRRRSGAGRAHTVEP
jgi:hypothetical protein